MIFFNATKNFSGALLGFISPQAGEAGNAVALQMTGCGGTHCIAWVQSSISPRRACGCSWAAEQGSAPRSRAVSKSPHHSPALRSLNALQTRPTGC